MFSSKPLLITRRWASASSTSGLSSAIMGSALIVIRKLRSRLTQLWPPIRKKWGVLLQREIALLAPKSGKSRWLPAKSCCLNAKKYTLANSWNDRAKLGIILADWRLRDCKSKRFLKKLSSLTREYWTLKVGTKRFVPCRTMNSMIFLKWGSHKSLRGLLEKSQRTIKATWIRLSTDVILTSHSVALRTKMYSSSKIRFRQWETFWTQLSRSLHCKVPQMIKTKQTMELSRQRTRNSKTS